MDNQNYLARHSLWMARLHRARKNYEREVKAINRASLPMFVLSLNRQQLAQAYTSLFKKPAPAKVADVAAAIIQQGKPNAVLLACERAQRGTIEGCSTDPERRRQTHDLWRERNRGGLRARARLGRLDPQTATKDADYRRSKREENRARTKAWWAAMSPDDKRRYVQDQWKRRKARLKSDPTVYEAYREQKRRQIAAQRARIANDPVARAADERKRKEKSERLRERRREYYQRVVKTNPELMARRREHTKRSQRKLSARKALAVRGAPENLTEQIADMIPRSFPPELKSDLVNDLVVAVISGEATLRKLPAMLRRYATQARKVIGDKWRQMSLDDMVPGTDGLRWIDTIASDQQHF